MHDSRGEWLHEMAVQDSKGVFVRGYGTRWQGRWLQEMAARESSPRQQGEMAARDGGMRQQGETAGGGL